MMKTFFSKGVAFLLAASLLVASLTSCKNDDDDDDEEEVSSGSSSVVLPSSVGTNELTGLTFEDSNDARVKTWKFEDSTATYTREDFEDSKGDGSINTKTYSYAYDSTNKIITLKLTKVSFTDEGKTYSYSSASEYKSLAKSEGGVIDEAELNYVYDNTAAEFNTPVAYKYTLDSTSLTLTPYFNGSLPTNVEFTYHDSSYSVGLYLEDGEFEVYAGEKAIGFPTFSNNSFSVNLYSWSYDESTDEETTYSVGTAKGTYSVTGSGASATVSLTFTELPSSFTAVSVNTAYELSQNDDDGETFTKK